MLPTDSRNYSEAALEDASVLTSVLTPDSVAPVLDPSDLILTRGTLDEEDEEAESDTDDIDHRGERSLVGLTLLRLGRSEYVVSGRKEDAKPNSASKVPYVLHAHIYAPRSTCVPLL